MITSRKDPIDHVSNTSSIEVLIHDPTIATAGILLKLSYFNILTQNFSSRFSLYTSCLTPKFRINFYIFTEIKIGKMNETEA